MNSEYSLSDIAAATGGNSGFGGNDGGWWIILLFIFIAAFGGWGNNGNNGGGFGGSGAGYVSDNYALITDNATLERKIDGVYSGICDSTFALNNTITNGFASAQNTMVQGFAGLNTAIVQNGYDGLIATHNVSDAVKDCCCQTQQNIKDTQYVISNTGNAIQSQIQNCCCDVERQIERGFADTNYAMASQNCATLQAIDKVGDRIIDRLTQDKLDALRDENSALRLSASQSAQNQYLINQLKPCPSPAYVVPNPYCNCQCGQNYGTTIA